MKLNVPKDDAIRIINERLSELNSFDFDPKVWKDRTVIDFKQIFPSFDQWLQVSQIQFETYIEKDKIKTLEKGKATAKKLLNSYIDFIRQHSAIRTKEREVVETSYKDKYRELLAKWNEFVPQYNDLLSRHSDLVDTTNSLYDKIEELETQLKESELSEELFPFEIIENTRGYLENIAKQAILCYQNGLYDGCLVLIRKLIEGLIIECFEKHGIAENIKGADDNYLYLSDLIRITISETTFTISRNSKKAFPEIKKFADLAAHNRRFNAKKADLDKIKGDVRIIIEELVHIAEIKRT